MLRLLTGNSSHSGTLDLDEKLLDRLRRKNIQVKCEPQSDTSVGPWTLLGELREGLHDPILEWVLMVGQRIELLDTHNRGVAKHRSDTRGGCCSNGEFGVVCRDVDVGVLDEGCRASRQCFEHPGQLAVEGVEGSELDRL
jgi:hypothetical protein